MKDNRKKYLVKRRRYGFGWTPASWQAWMLVGVQLIIIIMAAINLPTKSTQPSLQQLLSFAIIVLCAVLTLVLFSYLFGPSPKWRWGKKSTDDPTKDI